MDRRGYHTLSGGSSHVQRRHKVTAPSVWVEKSEDCRKPRRRSEPSAISDGGVLLDLCARPRCGPAAWVRQGRGTEIQATGPLGGREWKTPRDGGVVFPSRPSFPGAVREGIPRSSPGADREVKKASARLSLAFGLQSTGSAILTRSLIFCLQSRRSSGKAARDHADRLGALDLD